MAERRNLKKKKVYSSMDKVLSWQPPLILRKEETFFSVLEQSQSDAMFLHTDGDTADLKLNTIVPEGNRCWSKFCTASTVVNWKQGAMETPFINVLVWKAAVLDRFCISEDDGSYNLRWQYNTCCIIIKITFKNYSKSVKLQKHIYLYFEWACCN